MLSKRQQAILRFLYSYSQTNGFFPTIREICEGADISSTSVVKYNLGKLVDLGYLKHSPRRSRSNTLTGQAFDLLNVSTNPKSQRATEYNSLEHEVRRLRIQIEHLKHAHQVEIDTYLEERTELIDEINRLKMALPM